MDEGRLRSGALPGPGCSARARAAQVGRKCARLPARPRPHGGRAGAAATQTLARTPPARPAPLTHSPRPAAGAEGDTGPHRGPAVRGAATGAGGSMPLAVSARGRSRTRRRSALSGAHPALQRPESRHRLETPSRPRSGALPSFPARTSSLDRMVAGTREDRSAKNENVYCCLFYVSCFQARVLSLMLSLLMHLFV